MINMATGGTAWPGFKYKPITAVVDRVVNRYLRTQRKNMRRFFAERGLFDELEKMELIRKSRQGPMAKNRMFREVLDAYAKRTAPQPAVPEADSPEVPGAPAVALSAPAAVDGDTREVRAADASGPGTDAGSSVHGLAGEDGGPVIEE